MPTIRLATTDDLDQVVTLRMAFLREMKPDAAESESEVLELTREYVADKLPKGEFHVWFAEEDGQIVGTSGLVFFHRPPTRSYRSELHAYVLNMYTLPERRGRGIASMLLQHTIDYVKTTPASRISLHATEMGRPIYERFGFVASDSAMTLNL
jgi:GNAT superfamily N-acetyltransferase